MARLKTAFASSTENTTYRAFYFGMALTYFMDDQNNRYVGTDYQKIPNLEPFSNCEMKSSDALACLERGEIDLAVVEHELVQRVQTDLEKNGSEALQVRAVLDFTKADDASPCRLAVVTKVLRDSEQSMQARLVTALINKKYSQFAMKRGLGMDM